MTGSGSLHFITHAQDGSAGDWQQPQQPALHQGAGSLHSIDTGFQLHSRLSHIDDSEFELQHSFGSGFLRQQHCSGWEREVDDWCCARPSAGSAAGRDGDALTGGIEAADGTLEWFEGRMQEVRAAQDQKPCSHQLLLLICFRCTVLRKFQRWCWSACFRVLLLPVLLLVMQFSVQGGWMSDSCLAGVALQPALQAADEGDMTAAEQLWCSLQAAGLQPSRKFMNLFLM